MYVQIGERGTHLEEHCLERRKEELNITLAVFGGNQHIFRNLYEHS